MTYTEAATYGDGHVTSLNFSEGDSRDKTRTKSI